MEPTPETSDLVQRKSAPSSRPVTRQRKGRSRATNDPAYLARDHTGLRQARRRRDLIRMFIAALPGGPDAVTDLMLVGVRKAAELTVAAEAARAAVLNGGSCAADLDMLVKLGGEARRATRALALRIDAAKPGTASPPLPWSPLRARINAPAN